MDSFIRTSANFISQNSEHVRINDTKVKDFCQNMISNSNLPKVDFNHSLHPNCTTDTDFIDWIFIIDSLNFCFWKSPDQPQWTVTYEGITYSGYFALCAALKKAKTVSADFPSPVFPSSACSPGGVGVFVSEFQHCTCKSLYYHLTWL
uniref:Queuosine 5'-phosphate N-glycosylase/hydrolase n=1 Tax=Cacopsylla melanoneura TaxID=428564 RepID=A0A8D8WVM3_9HEMI